MTTSSGSLSDTFNSTVWYMQKINSRFHVVGVNYYNGEELNKYEGRLSKKTKNEYLETIERKANGSVSSHMIKECPKEYILAYMLYKNSPYISDINWVISRIVEAGLVTKWNGDSMINSTLSTKSKEVQGKGFPRPFSVTDLQASFYILLIGSIAGMVIFIIERMSIYLKKN